MQRIVVFIIALASSMAVMAQYNIQRVMLAGRGALYYEDYVLSIQYFNQAINAKPYLYEPWYLRAIAKYNLDDFNGAELDCDEAIKLNPYISGIYDLRGVCRIRQEKYEQAAADYDLAIRHDPNNQGYWYNRALCRLQDKDYERANIELDSMINRWKGNAKSLQLKAEVCLQQGDTTKAAKYLDRSLDVDRYDGEAWAVRAMISMSRSKWKDADQQLSEAIHLKPSTAAYYVNRAMTRYNLNNLRGAMADYDKAIELEPNNFLAHYNRGQLRIQVGDDNRAIEDFDFIIGLEPDNFMAIFNRALLLDRTGDLYGAIRDYSEVIEQFPNFWAGLQYRASCYRRLGMTAKAEMDEFRIFKAQQDKHFGKQPRWTKKQRKEIRKKSDIDLDKYNQLVEEDEPTVEHEYASIYRGKVQNRKVDDDMMPMFILSYRQHNNGIKAYTAFDNEVEHFNSTHRPTHRIYISCKPKTLNESETRIYFALIDTLSVQIGSSKDLRQDCHLLMERAVAYAVTQDYDAAINDLTAFLQIDSQSAMAHWHRAVCQSMIYEFSDDRGIEQKIKSVNIADDFNEAIRLNPHNPYIYYDRANYYFARKQYTLAIDDYNRALSIDPNIAEAYYNRGLAHLHEDRMSEGITDLSKAGELGLYDAYSVIKKYRKK